MVFQMSLSDTPWLRQNEFFVGSARNKVEADHAFPCLTTEEADGEQPGTAVL